MDNYAWLEKKLLQRYTIDDISKKTGLHIAIILGPDGLRVKENILELLLLYLRTREEDAESTRRR